MTPRTAVATAAAALGLLSLSAPAHAGLTYTSLSALRYNPLGLQQEATLGWRQKLGSAPQDNVLFGKSHFRAGIIGRASPQFAKGGAFVKLAPIAVFEVQASIQGIAGLSSVQDVQESGIFTGATKQMVTDAGGIIDNGWQMSVAPVLKYKVADIVIRNTALFRNFNLQGEEGDLFYDQTLDVIAPIESWALQNDADVLYWDTDKRWILGARYTYTTVFGREESDIQRVGPLFAWKPEEKKEGGGFANPTLFTIAQCHVEHAYRTGQEMSQAVPYFVVGFSFNGAVTD